MNVARACQPVLKNLCTAWQAGATNMIDSDLITKVRRALGRTEPLTSAPVPPTIDEPIARLVHSDLGLPELFAERAKELHMHVTPVSPEEVGENVVAFLREHGCRKIAMSGSKLLERLEIETAIRNAGLLVRRWEDMTLDELYEYDCGVTDCTYAVAECGGLVIKPSAKHGRGVSLVPMFHIAIVEPKNFLPDMIDLMERIAADPERHNWIMITGPSKTADIEMNVVLGVHGPNVVHTFILS